MLKDVSVARSESLRFMLPFVGECSQGFGKVGERWDAIVDVCTHCEDLGCLGA